MNINDYDYPLPESLIADYPLLRGKSRMMILDKKKGTIEHALFSDLNDILNPPMLITRNITKVIKTRLFAKRKTGGEIEILILNPYAKGYVFNALIKKGGRLHTGEMLSIGPCTIKLINRKDEVFIVEFDHNLKPIEIFEQFGHVPLPPYIKRNDEKSDEETYQTVFSDIPGSSAAPTAGLHFSEEMIIKMKEKGIEFNDVLLHVGLGTFEPVKTDTIEAHIMHEEYYEVGIESADMLNKAKENNIPILAIGTTTMRVLETIYSNDKYHPNSGMTDIFIYPPYRIESADMMITNFHLPKSTLLMLVSAFAGREFIMKAYRDAVERKYRFYSYGDCMLIR